MTDIQKMRGSSLAGGMATEIIGVLLIGYAFLTAEPLSSKIMIMLAVVFFLCAFDSLRNYSSLMAEYQLRKLFQDSWLDSLTFRFAFDQVVAKVKDGWSISIDWSNAQDQAVSDIKSHRSATEVLNNKPVSFGLQVTGSLIGAALLAIIRGLAGYGLAWAAHAYAANFVRQII